MHTHHTLLVRIMDTFPGLFIKEGRNVFFLDRSICEYPVKADFMWAGHQYEAILFADHPLAINGIDSIHVLNFTQMYVKLYSDDILSKDTQISIFKHNLDIVDKKGEYYEKVELMRNYTINNIINEGS